MEIQDILVIAILKIQSLGISKFMIMYLLIWEFLWWKERLNNDVQQLHQYEQNEQPLLIKS